MVAIDVFLWPMLLPLVPLIPYVYLKKRGCLPDVVAIAFSVVIIVVAYWPLTTVLVTPANIAVKFLLFVFLPVLVLLFVHRRTIKLGRADFGLQTKGIKASLAYGLVFLPIMLLVTFLAQWSINGLSQPDPILGVVSFLEAFTEEFFFRGILFLFLLPRTSLPVAYSVSLISFVLMHPQQLTSLFLIVTVVQGILTLEICRRSRNLTGAWMLHGANRFFSIAILPFFL